MLYRVLSTLAALCLLAACGGEAEKTMDAMSNMKNIAESADDAQKTMEDMEALQKARIARGDTIAMSYEVLQKYLPSSIGGYTTGEPSGENVSMPGASFGQASCTYTASDGKDIHVQLTDYNSNAFGIAALTPIFAMNIRVDNSDETSGTFQTGNDKVNGHERWGKKDKTAKIMYSIAGRFILEVSGNNQSSLDEVKAVAKSMNISDLATK